MLSIIIVNHNSFNFLKECISSITSSKINEPFEIILVDSGSKENEVLDLLSLADDNIRVILNKENIGYAQGINQGVGVTNGNILLLSNPDIFFC